MGDRGKQNTGYKRSVNIALTDGQPWSHHIAMQLERKEEDKYSEKRPMRHKKYISDLKLRKKMTSRVEEVCRKVKN